ncbi:TPA: hypothetical protein DCG61_03255 [Patescibacteria group bacterium]|jgi:hypothetical protein|nr:hypothetical protein [Patescibacteria group bacterium]
MNTNIICDGCNVHEPYEHRCHGADQISIGGEIHAGPCGCECQRKPTSESLAKWMAAGRPKKFEFEYE